MYVVSVGLNAYYSATPAGLATEIAVGPLRSVADGQNGVYAPTAGVLPTSSSNNANYFVDLITMPGTASPPDAAPPVVSISSPAGGTTVSGTVTVTANASDDVGVAGVQFLLDGVNLGTEDTTAPYSVSWNTTTAANGNHTLSARARDAAGSQTTSALVAVTASNVAAGLVAAYGFEETGAQVVDSSSTAKYRNDLASGADDRSLRQRAPVRRRQRPRERQRLGVPGSHHGHDARGMGETDRPPDELPEHRRQGADDEQPCLPADRGQHLVEPPGQPRLRTGTPFATLFGGSQLGAGVWVHLAATYDGANQRLFVNGTQVASAAQTGALTATTNALRLGGSSTMGQYFNGVIDEVRIYNRALSQTQIQADMNAPVVPPASDTTPPVLSSGQPSGQLTAGTTQATLQVTTNESANCRYSTTAGVAYASMSATFATTGGTAHSTIVAGLANGASYTYYVRCQDGSSNATTSDYQIAFSVGAPPAAPTVTQTTPDRRCNRSRDREHGARQLLASDGRLHDHELDLHAHSPGRLARRRERELRLGHATARP